MSFEADLIWSKWWKIVECTCRDVVCCSHLSLQLRLIHSVRFYEYCFRCQGFDGSANVLNCNEKFEFSLRKNDIGASVMHHICSSKGTFGPPKLTKLWLVRSRSARITVWFKIGHRTCPLNRILICSKVSNQINTTAKFWKWIVCIRAWSYPCKLKCK